MTSTVLNKNVINKAYSMHLKEEIQFVNFCVAKSLVFAQTEMFFSLLLTGKIN